MPRISAKEVFRVYFVKEDSELLLYERSELAAYQPWFVHQLFPEETIVGYEDLEIKLLYHLGSYEVLLEVSYSHKDSNVPGFVDVESILSHHLPTTVRRSVSSLKEPEWIRKRFDLVHPICCETLRERNEQVRVYQGSITNEFFKQCYECFQFLLLLFIETASYIDVLDNQWDMFLLVGMQDELLGLATVYRFSCFDTREGDWDIKEKPRISQFLIIPKFHSQGLGTILLDAIYQHYLSSSCTEITVESPCEGFQQLRDFVDTKNCLLKRIVSLEKDMKEANNKIYSQSIVDRIQSELKLTRKQAMRCFDILLFYSLSLKSDEKGLYDFRMAMKQRLYKQQYELFMDLDSTERKTLLWQLYNEQIEQYGQVISSIRNKLNTYNT